MNTVSKIRRGVVLQGALVASAIVAFLSVLTLLMIPGAVEPKADMRIEPHTGVVAKGDSFTLRVVVTADTPTNVFKGEIRFDHTLLAVTAIEYNTSIANLWAEKPWYENGEGTINFIGGTTEKSGFLGTGTLMTITFVTLAEGDALLHLEGARILEHNGLGTDAPLKESIDGLFTVAESVIEAQTVASPRTTTTSLTVVSELPSTDLNGDGKQSIADVSIFMLNMLGTETRFDFNRDGMVNATDLSILMSTK